MELIAIAKALLATNPAMLTDDALVSELLTWCGNVLLR
jgi:hypothetical protein